MDKQESNKFYMYRAVLTVTSEFASEVQNVPALATCVNDFTNSVKTIEKQDQVYQNAAKGATAAKHKIADELIEQTMILGNPLHVYGIENGNNNLAEIASVTESALKRLRESALLQKGKAIIEQLEPLQNNLSAYGIKQELISRYNETITAYDKAMNHKDSKHIETVSAREALHGAFNTTDNILNQKLDKLMEIMKINNKEFYNRYQQARVIKDLGTRHLKSDEQPVESTN